MELRGESLRMGKHIAVSLFHRSCHNGPKQSRGKLMEREVHSPTADRKHHHPCEVLE